jgi:plasmid stabilization system protein ParE
MEEAIRWYSASSPYAAAGFKREITEAMQAVLLHPERGRQIEGRMRRVVLRRFPFSIIYRVRGEEILIIALAHASRLPAYWATRTAGPPS